MFRDIEMKNFAPTMLDDKKTIQNSEGESRYSEKIHGRNDFSMIAQKRSPELVFLVGRRQAMDIARNGEFGNMESELEQFTVNSRCSPCGILLNHPTNDRWDLGIDFRPANVL